MSFAAKGSALATLTTVSDTMQKVCALRKTVTLYYDWSAMRYASDAIHVVALLLGFAAAIKNSSVVGLSLKCHILFLLCAWCHGLNVMVCPQGTYVIVYKGLFFGLSLLIMFTFICFRYTHDVDKDSCSLGFLLIPTLLCTFFFAEYEGSVIGFFWSMSWMLEAFASLPQLILCYRDFAGGTKNQPLLRAYALSLFGHRALIGASHIYLLVADMVNPEAKVIDMMSIVSSSVHLTFFADYLLLHGVHWSPLSSVVLTIDDGLVEAFAVVEKSLGFRLDPIGLYFDIWLDRSLPPDHGMQERVSAELELEALSSQGVPVGDRNKEATAPVIGKSTVEYQKVKSKEDSSAPVEGCFDIGDTEGGLLELNEEGSDDEVEEGMM